MEIPTRACFVSAKLQHQLLMVGELLLIREIVRALPLELRHKVQLM